MRIYILLAHPDSESFNGQIAEAYAEQAQKKGHEVRVQKLGEMTFDPILRQGFKANQGLEADLQEAQANLIWCDKWLIIYPVWWGSVPALLKGFLDRTLLPGFAFKYHQNDPFWDKLLKGKTAEIITTSDSPAWWLWWQYHNSDLNAIRKATLEFCGFSYIKTTRISRVRFLKPEERKKQIQKIISKIK
ncbi:MAG: NAD(P)H-dependent oxidoreductase [Thermonemataceae bacterium]|nr:NAD(P)H-dependent oxidoreductase [Thermonemataceae bacterium]